MSETLEDWHEKPSKNSEYYQRFRKPLGRTLNPIRANERGHYQSDVAYIPYRGKLRSVIAVIEITTRKLYARVGTGSSMKQEEAVKLMKEMLDEAKDDGIKCVEMLFDNGVEYGNKMRELMKERNIEFIYAQPYMKNQQAIVERSWRTLRELIVRYTTEISDGWVSQFQSLVGFYNSKVHTSINVSPDEAVADKDISNEIMVQADKKSKLYMRQLNSFKPGDVVRIPEHLRNENINLGSSIPKKKNAIWSKELYTVNGTSGFYITLKEIDRKFPPRWLQKVNESTIVPITHKSSAPKETTRIKTKKANIELNEIDTQLPTNESKALITRRQKRSQTILPKEKDDGKDSALTRSQAIHKEKPAGKKVQNKAEKIGDRDVVERIESHKMVDGEYRFKVIWKGTKNSLTRSTWEADDNFIKDGLVSDVLTKYCLRHRLAKQLEILFGSSWKKVANESITKWKMMEVDKF